jgi:hypothetical protein
MSSGIFSVGRLDRKFIYESSISPNERKLRYNDPSFVTFRVLFDFEPVVSNDEVMQGLLLNESRDESAVSYLRRMGETERAELLKEFTWMLGKITNDFPWFFKTIQGIDGLWKWGHTDLDGNTQSSPVDLTIDCYETVDMRVTALADLYRKATRDRRYFRDLLTMDKKRFNMTILVGEARNLRTYVDTNRTDWLNHVSTIAFRCLDCEFDFSKTVPSNMDASEAPVQLSPSFGIRVHRVQETNSYLLLDYMLGEIKRDLVIKQGGSGAEVNQGYDIIDYRSLLAPFVRSYEGNYSQVITDANRNVSQNFINQLSFTTGDRTSRLTYAERQTLNTQQLNGISKQGERASVASALLETSSRIAADVVSFGVPTVDEEISDAVDLTPSGANKINETVANQIEFSRPKVETSLPNFSFNKPTVDDELDDNVGLTKPTVQTEIGGQMGLTAPTVNTDEGVAVDLTPPGVATKTEGSIRFVRPTVQTSTDGSIQFERPTVETGLDPAVSFGRPSVATKTDGSIKFLRPTVMGESTEQIAFEKPKVEDGFGT